MQLQDLATSRTEKSSEQCETMKVEHQMEQLDWNEIEIYKTTLVTELL